jgi:hypothetical protein
MLALLWGRRHTALLWYRTLRAELGRGRPYDAHRARTLASALMRVTTDGRLANAPELRSLRLDGDVIHADVDGHWARRGVLRATLGGVEGINVVRLSETDDATSQAEAILENAS